jgi:hypothetical protein
MEPDDYPTYESTEPVFDWLNILGPIRCPDHEHDGELCLAQEAERAARAAGACVDLKSESVGKVEKAETPFELWTRVSTEKQAKAVKSAKAAAKKSVKKKQMWKISSHFTKWNKK